MNISECAYRIAVIYFSETETTHNLAVAIIRGCDSVANVQAIPHRIRGTDITEGRFQKDNCLELVDASDAVIFGSPTYMGGPAAQFKAFADATSDRWDTQRWSGKIAAGFTVGANPNGDQLATLQYFSVLAAQHGMIWIGLDIPGGFDEQGRNSLGSQLGMSAHCLSPEPNKSDIDTAEYLGSRVARTRLIPKT